MPRHQPNRGPVVTRMLSVIGRFLLLAFVVALAGGCRADAPRRRIVTQVEAGDSAGVSRVRIADLQGLRLPEVRGRRVWSSESPEVSGARDAWIESDGTVLVASAGTSEIVRMSEEGHPTDRFGSRGEGPGEFAELGLRWIDASREDRITAYDERLGRLTMFDDRGELVEILGISSESYQRSLRPVAWADRDRILATRRDLRRIQGEGLQRDSAPLLVLPVGSPGSVSRSASPGGGRGREEPGNAEQGTGPRSIDTLGVWAGREWFSRQGSDGFARVPVGLGYDFLQDGAGTVAAVASSEALDVQIFHDGVLRAVVYGETAPRVVGSDEARRVREELAAQAPEGMAEVWAEAPVNEIYPILDALVVVQDGKVWIGLQPGVGEATREFLILEDSGIPVGRLKLPRELEVLAATSTHFVARRLDEPDGEWIELWRID